MCLFPRQLQPPIVVLEDVYECKDLEQLLVAAGALSRRPYIIAALSSGTTKGIPLHQLLFHHQIRWVWQGWCDVTCDLLICPCDSAG